MRCFRLLLFTFCFIQGACGDALDHWTLRDSTTNKALKAIAYANGTYVVAGVQEVVLTSTNGITWVSTNFGVNNSFYGLTHANNQFVAVGHEFAYPCPAFVSPDGTSWVGYDMGTGGGNFNAITFGGGQFVTVGASGFILTSPNGSNWTWQTSGTTQHLLGIAVGNGVYVAAGDRVVLTSSNAVNWTVQSHPEFGGRANAVFYTNGFFFIGRDYGNIDRSSDGLTWSNVFSNGGRDLRAITYGNGTYVAGGGGPPNLCILLTSTNGIDWMERTIWPQQFANLYPNAIVFANNKFTVVCENGIILESADVTIPWLSAQSWNSTNGSTIGLSGAAGLSYRLQGTTNLSSTNWIDLGRVTNDLPTVLFQDSSATNLPRRFYRALGP